MHMTAGLHHVQEGSRNTSLGKPKTKELEIPLYILRYILALYLALFKVSEPGLPCAWSLAVSAFASRFCPAFFTSFCISVIVLVLLYHALLKDFPSQ